MFIVKELEERGAVEKKVAKGEFFLEAWKKQNFVGIVKSGLFRFYYLDSQGNEHTKHFVKEGGFVISFNAFYKDEVSEFFIKAEEDSTLLVINVKDLKRLIREDELIRSFYYNSLEESYSLKERRSADLLIKNSSERYIDFINNYSDIVKRVKQHHLASYLGIKPESLSRIKKNLT